MNKQETVLKHFTDNCDSNGIITADINELSKILHTSNAYAYEILRKLQSNGLVKRNKRGSGKGQRNSEYIVVNKDNTTNFTAPITINNDTTDIRKLAEFAIQSILVMADIVAEKDRQCKEMSDVATEINSKITKVMEVLAGG